MLRLTLLTTLLHLLSVLTFGQDGPGGAGSISTDNRFWYAASNLSLTDGDPVATVANIGANANDLTQNTANRQPTFGDNAVDQMNGYPVIKFDGNNDFLSIANNTDLNTAADYNRSYSMTFRTGADVATRQVLFEEGGTVRGLNFYIFNNQLYFGIWNLPNDGTGSPWGFSFSSIAILPSTNYILSFVFDGNSLTTGTATCYLNGTLVGSINGIGQLYGHSGAIALGAKNGDTYFESGASSGTGNYFTGDIAEFIHYNRALNNAEISLINNYQSSKYDIIIANDLHLMDVGAAGNYDHEVAGIGMALDGTSSTNGTGSSIINVSSPSNLSNGEFMLWGHNQNNLSESAINTPAGFDLVLERSWRVSENFDVGTTTLIVDISNLSLSGATASDYALAIDPSDNNFSDGTTQLANSLSNGLLTFNNVNLSNGDHFTLAINFAPVGNSGPGGVYDNDVYTFWFRADLLSLNDGDLVSNWNNVGGNTNNATQNGNRRPSFQDDAASVMNGHPIVRFDGSNDYLEIADNSDINVGTHDERSFHMAFRTGGNVSNRQVLFEEGGGVRGLNAYIFGGQVYIGAWNLNNDGAGSPWGYVSINTGISANTDYVLSWIYNGNGTSTGTIEAYLNGSLFGTINNVGILYQHVGDIGIGAKSNDTYYETGSSSGDGQYFGGDIAEFIIFDQALNDARRVIVDNYLSAKYGITLTADDEYTMDNIGNGDFDHDVAGIGQAPDGSAHTDARGTGIVQMQLADNLNTGEYLLWGHNDDVTCSSSDTPSGINSRITRTWRTSENGEVGNHEISFDLAGFTFTDINNVRLLIDNDGVFSDASVFSPIAINGNVVSWSGINVNDGQYFTVAATDYLSGRTEDTTIWDGSANTTWSTPANWSNGVPDSSMTVIIPNTAPVFPVLSGSGECANITIEPSASLEIAGTNQLDVHGLLNFQGAFIANTSTINLTGTCNGGAISLASNTVFNNIIINKPEGVSISGAEVQIQGSLYLNDGVLNTNNLLVILSNASGTGRIPEIINGSLNGDIEMQRYVDAGATNWRFLTSAVSGTDLEQFDDDFITSGIPGSDYPLWPSPTNPWPSFYFYNEDLGITFDDGYVVPSSMNDVLSVGQGVWIWCGDTITGTQPFVVDFFGPANTGIINLPVDFNVASGNMDDDGWNMVGNPYPCTIDWDDPAWTKDNIEDAIYIWNPDIQQYATYVAGVGVNGGSNLIASSQAFMVHADASNPQLTVTEECKEDADAPFIRASNISTDLLRLEISDGSYWDETVIRFDQNLTNHFDKYADAYKKQYQYPVGPSIMSQLNGVSYSINTLYPDSLYFEIPLHVKHINNGTHHIKALDINAINGYSCVVLEDKLTGAVMNLHTDSIYTYNGSINEMPNRFVIKFSMDTRISSNDISCNDEVDGEIHFEGFFPGSIIEIISDSLISNTSMLSSYHIIDSLYAGNYTVTITDPHGACPIVTDMESIDNPATLTAIMNNNNASCTGCCDGMIEILPAGGSSPYSYEFNGVSCNSTISNLCAGNYTITITDANGCSYHDQALIYDGITSIDDAGSSYNVYPNPAHDVVNISADHVVSVKLYDATGRLVMSDDNQSSYVIDVSVLASGSYFLLIDQTKEVLIIR